MYTFIHIPNGVNFLVGWEWKNLGHHKARNNVLFTLTIQMKYMQIETIIHLMTKSITKEFRLGSNISDSGTN